MQQVYQSASKIVFIMLGLTACAGFLAKILEAQDFMMLSGMAFAFYFAHKGEAGKPTEEAPGGNPLPFAGK